MKKVIVASVLLGSASASIAASAAEPFNGPFIGVQAGWSRDEVGTASTPLGNLAIHSGNDTVTGGLFAGYDHKVTPKVVAGVEAGINLSDSDDLAGTTASIDAERSIDLTARLGYLATDTTLLYARGGYSNVRAETMLTNASGTLNDTSDLDGWLVGAGVERALTQSISTRLEYRYSDLSEGDGKFDRHQILVGASYHF